MENEMQARDEETRAAEPRVDSDELLAAFGQLYDPEQMRSLTELAALLRREPFRPESLADLKITRDRKTGDLDTREIELAGKVFIRIRPVTYADKLRFGLDKVPDWRQLPDKEKVGLLAAVVAEPDLSGMTVEDMYDMDHALPDEMLLEIQKRSRLMYRYADLRIVGVTDEGDGDAEGKADG